MTLPKAALEAKRARQDALADAKERAKRYLAKKGRYVLGDPAVEMEWFIGELKRMDEFWEQEIFRLFGDEALRYESRQGGTEQGRAEMEWFLRIRVELGQALANWNRLGIADRKLALAEAQAAQVASAVGAIVSGILGMVRGFVPASELAVIEAESVPALVKRHLSSVA